KGTEFALALHTGAGTDAVTIDGQRQGLSWHNSSASVWVSTPEGDRELLIHTPARRADTGAGVPTLDSPMPGTVVAVMAADGDAVEAGEPVLAVEAMKMEHLLRAPSAGIVRLHVKEGQSVARGQELAQVRQQEGDHD